MLAACQGSANVPARPSFEHYDSRHPISYGVQLPMGASPVCICSGQLRGVDELFATRLVWALHDWPFSQLDFARALGVLRKTA